MRNFIQKASFEIQKFSMMYKELEVSAHAAASSFYLFLSIIPLIALVLTIIPYTPLKQEQIQAFMEYIIPSRSLNNFVEAVTLQMYEDKGPFFLLVSAIFLVWSAGKGMQAITRGLNAVNGVKNEKRSFILLRVEACIYTIVLLIFLISTVSVTFLARFVLTRLIAVFHWDLTMYLNMLNNRYLVEWIVFTVFFCLLYGWVPNRKSFPHKMWRGALFAGVTCTLFSWAFSYYLEHFHGFSMYGSMATIVITMVWLFTFMTLFFAGALLNVYFQEVHESRKNRRVEGQTIFEEEILVKDFDKYRSDPNGKQKKRLKKRRVEKQEIQIPEVTDVIKEEMQNAVNHSEKQAVSKEQVKIG